VTKHTPAPRKLPLHALTGLRFLAALYVVSLHYAPKSLKAAAPALENFIASGYTAVSFFFVLSGFVLTYSYMDSEGTITVPRRTFWVARLARIYPAYVFALLLMFPKFWSDMLDGGGTMIRVIGRVTVFGGISAGLLQAWWPKTALLWNFPGWTLSVEAFFYITFPFLTVWLVSRWRTKRVLLTAIILLWALSQTVPIIYLALDPEKLGNPSPAWSGLFTGHFDGFWMRFVRFNPLLHLPEFVMGMCLGKLFLIQPSYRGGGFVAPGALMFLCAALVCSSLLPFPMLHNGLLAPVVCVLIYALACGGGVLGRLLSTRPFRLAGEASYSIYILQVPIWMAFSRIIGSDQPRGIADFLGYLTVLFIISILVLWFIEIPGREMLKNRLGRAKPRRQPASVIPVVASTRENS
jgi:peptidoglycan/LPS O-acetylase OafA/YrhL